MTCESTALKLDDGAACVEDHAGRERAAVAIAVMLTLERERRSEALRARSRPSSRSMWKLAGRLERMGIPLARPWRRSP